MSLYFEECVEEERTAAADPDKITFVFPWIFDIPPLPEDSKDMMISHDISVCTNYNLYSTEWKLFFTKYCFAVENLDEEKIEFFEFWNECTFFITYKLYSDSEMCSKIYSSERIAFIRSLSYAYTSFGAMKTFSNAFIEKKLAKVVFFVEFVLPKKYFDRPFDFLRINTRGIECDKYPEDIENDFRFEFLNESDFTFKCTDGTVPSLKMVLNISSLLMKKYLNETKNDELVVEHAVDVVKPVITYLHSHCFEMPKSYNPEYADRLLKAIIFFDLEDKHERQMVRMIHHSLRQKFITEPHDFELIVQWASLVSRHSAFSLTHIIPVVIANKYYYEWLERFPENTRIPENQMLQNIFGSIDDAFWIFEDIEDNFMGSLIINTIIT